MPRQLLTINQVCEALQVSRSTLYTWIRQGKIRVCRLSRRTRIDPHELELFIRRHTDRPKPHTGDRPCQ
jgi:excisionase family DNA binding protein